MFILVSIELGRRLMLRRHGFRGNGVLRVLIDTVNSIDTGVIQVFDAYLSRVSFRAFITLRTLSMVPEGGAHGLGM